MDAIEFLHAMITQLSGTEPDLTKTVEDSILYLNFSSNADMRYVIGKKGKTIDVLRTVACVLGLDGNHNIKVRLNANTE